MNSKTFPDFNTPAGIREVADHLDGLALEAHTLTELPRYSLGHLHIHPTARAFTCVAASLRQNAPRAGGKRGGVWMTPSCRIPMPIFDGKVITHWGTNQTKIVEGLYAMDSVRVCGSPEAALTTIRRQLEIQGESMDPSDVKRCQKAARDIENHLEVERVKAERAAADDIVNQRIKTGRKPDTLEIVPEGTEVELVANNGLYLGMVLSCKLGSSTICGRKEVVAVYKIEVTHKKEWRDTRFLPLPPRKRTTKKALWNDITILN